MKFNAVGPAIEPITKPVPYPFLKQRYGVLIDVDAFALSPLRRRSKSRFREKT